MEKMIERCSFCQIHVDFYACELYVTEKVTGMHIMKFVAGNYSLC